MKKITLLLLGALPLSFLISGCGNNEQKNKVPAHQIKIKSQPTKLTYNCGNDFDPSGMILEYYKNGVLEPTSQDSFTYENNLNLTTENDEVVVKGPNQTSKRISLEINPIFEGTITCVGDSLTEGHSWANECYPNYIKDYFTDSNLITIKNCGKNGASFKTFGTYNPAYNTTTQYNNSLSGKTQVITILLGTNDATNWTNESSDYVKDYTDLVELYQTTFPGVKIIMITSPRCTTNSFGIPNDTICNNVYPLQKQLSEDLELPLIDLQERFKDLTDAELFRDGVHLSQKAAKIVAEEIANKVQEIYGISE